MNEIGGEEKLYIPAFPRECHGGCNFASVNEMLHKKYVSELPTC
jgi:hypothetical protein